MKKILVGYIGKGKTSGIDKYLFSFLDKMNEENIQVDFLSRFRDKDLENKLSESGSKIYHISRNRHFIRQFLEMKKIIKNNNYDIAYFNISKATNCIGIIASKIFGIKKIVVHSHSSGVEDSNIFKKAFSYIFNYLFKFVISLCSDLNLACSDKAAKWLFSKNVYDNDDYYIIYNTVNYEKFKYNEKTRKSIRKKMNIDDKFVIGHVGRFSYPKNHKFLIDTFIEYLKINPNSVLLCIGDGPNYNDIKDYAKKNNVYKKIVFTGAIDNVNEVVQAFDCFLLPSKFEGLPIVGIEAQFSQTKCIFSDKITKMSLISNDNLFLPIRNPKTWAENISSKKTKLNENADNFKNEKNKKQFDVILNNKSGKYNLPFLTLKILLIIHYFLNLTVFYNGFNYLMFLCAPLILIIVFSNRFDFLKSKLKDKKIYLIYMAFLVSYLISFALMSKYSISGSVKVMIWSVLHLFFVFDTSYLQNKKDLKKELYLIFKINVLVLSIINIHNLYLLVNHVKTTTYDFEHKIHLLGLTKWGRFYGNFYDANYASISCVCVILMSVYLLKKCKSIIEKILLSLTILTQLIYIYFGQSRTGLVTLAAAILIYIFINFIVAKMDIKKIALSIVIFAFGILILPKESLKIYNNISKNNNAGDSLIVIDDSLNSINIISNMVGNNVPDDNNVKQNKKRPEPVIAETVVGRTDYNDDFSNGRFSIWKSGIEVFKKNIVFGIGFANIVDYTVDKMPNSFVAKNKFAAFHNTFIDLLVSQGIIGFIIGSSIFIYFVVLNIKKYKMVIKNKVTIKSYSIIISIIISIIFSSLFVSQIFYINNYVTFAFWMILGYMNYYLRMDSEIDEK